MDSKPAPVVPAPPSIWTAIFWVCIVVGVAQLIDGTRLGNGEWTGEAQGFFG